MYYAAEWANKFKMSKIILSLPGDTLNLLSSINLMRKELLLRGIEEQRIYLESEGNNTHNEVLRIKKMINDTLAGILVITSPEHLYRTVKCFHRTGFVNVSGVAAFERSLESGLLMANPEKGVPEAVPELGDSIEIRYRFWIYLQYEVMVLREYIAIGYYWLKGWI